MENWEGVGVCCVTGRGKKGEDQCDIDSTSGIILASLQIMPNLLNW